MYKFFTGKYYLKNSDETFNIYLDVKKETKLPRRLPPFHDSNLCCAGLDLTREMSFVLVLPLFSSLSSSFSLSLFLSHAAIPVSQEVSLRDR